MSGVLIHVQTKNYNDVTRTKLVRRMVRLAQKHLVPIETYGSGKIRFQQFHPASQEQESAIIVALKKSCLNFARIIVQ